MRRSKSGMRGGLVLIALLAAGCGGSSMPPNDWVGAWRSAPSVPGSYATMTLSGSGSTITGDGVQHVEAGNDRPFTVQGTSQPVPGPGVTFDYADGATEGFSFAQSDTNHLVLSNPNRALNFTRQ